METTYKSKISSGLLAFTFLTPLLLSIIPLLFETPVKWVVILILTLIFAIATWIIYLLFRSTHYAIKEDTLIVSIMGMRTIIKIDSITQIKETNNPLSAPAASLDRLEILYTRYKKQTGILISPQNKMKFIADIQDKNKNIIVILKQRKHASAG